MIICEKAFSVEITTPAFPILNWGELGVFNFGNGDHSFTPVSAAGYTINGFAESSGREFYGSDCTRSIQCNAVGLTFTGAETNCLFTATTSSQTGDVPSIYAWRIRFVGGFPTITLQYEPGNPGKTVWPFTLPAGFVTGDLWVQIKAQNTIDYSSSRTELAGTFSLA